MHPKTIDLGLDRVKSVYAKLLPDDRPPFTLTVGGTNGKGSSVAMLDAILRAEGYRVGKYTSPHLLRYNERIRINGMEASDEQICEAFERVDRARGDVSLSFFEFGTLAALDLFAKASLDVQILEVGLGGRLDAVNIIDADAAMIASIAIDHQDWLGDSREAIAIEKAGIFRSGRIAVVGDPAPPASLAGYARTRGIVWQRQGVDFGFERDGAAWHWFGCGGRMENLPPPAIAGSHQLYNASAVLQLLRSIGATHPVGDAAIRAGLQEVRLAGRFQFFAQPVPALTDVAHNPQAAEMLANHLRDHYPDKRVHAVFAIMRDKDIAGVIKPMKDLTDRWYLAPIPLARTATEPELLALFDGLGIARPQGGFRHAREAIETATRQAGPDDLVVVFGTFPLVAEFLAHNP